MLYSTLRKPLAIGILILSLAGCGPVQNTKDSSAQNSASSSTQSYSSLNSQVDRRDDTLQPCDAEENADKRTLVNRDDLVKLGPLASRGSDNGGNLDPANCFVAYRDEENGISFHIPFNPQWGTLKYRTAPYTSLHRPATSFSTFLVFGPLADDHRDGYLSQYYTLKFLPVQTFEAELASKQEQIASQAECMNLEYGGGTIHDLKVMDVGEYKAMTFTGGCDNPSFAMIVFGKQFMYLFRAEEFADRKTAEKDFIFLARTIEE